MSTDASIEGKVDHLLGLKENVIIGKLIPAGHRTQALPQHQHRTVGGGAGAGTRGPSRRPSCSPRSRRSATARGST